MKRRSARPFVVEVKTPSRTSLTTHHDGPKAVRTEGGLWRGLLAGTPTKPAAACAAPSSDVSRTQAMTPAPIARRILPNLMPLAAPDAAPNHPELVAPVIRRRGRPLATRSGPEMSPAAAARVPAPMPVPVAAATPQPVSRVCATAPTPIQSPSAVAKRPIPAHRRAEPLRPGERWKRRLSRFAR